MTTQLTPDTASSLFETQQDKAATLRKLCGGAVSLPGDPGYDAARQPWNVAFDQRPAAVAYPASAEEAAEVVCAAAAAGLRVAPQSTGHNSGPLVEGGLDDVVLLRTSAMTSVEIDPERRMATVGGGVLWGDVVEAAAAHGLDALHGSSPDVGVSGYSLGGGIGWFARKLGLQTNSITGATVVTADGQIRRVDAKSEPEMFWALRGGGGNVGVVTSLEFRLYPIDSAYGGMLAWDWSRAEEVLTRWAAWAVDAPDEVTTSFRILQLPPLPEIPEPIRGRNLVMIDGAVLADDSRAEEILAPLRELEPEIDTFGRVPAVALTRIHGDPEGPTPGVSDSAMLGALTADAIRAFVDAAGPGSGSTLLAAELRQLGGQLGRPQAGAGALPKLDGQFVLFGVGFAITPEMGAQASVDARRLMAALRPWSNGRKYLNFAESAVDPSTGYASADFARLQAVRAAVDPNGLSVANHRVPVAASEPAASRPSQLERMVPQPR
ncbi:MAG TPA: FAD-binding oxidoreductase [Frankiaceae bacterium]|nr:FAD-binding oxidoreductase [Frankiaceae bacterium]